MKIYLAARYSRRLELVGYKDQLQAQGHEVPARWLLGQHQLDNEGRPIGEDGEALVEAGSDDAGYYREKFAQDDYDDVLSSDLLIAFTEEPRSGNSRGGRHVELGLALGRGIPVIIVGPRENVFCWLPQVTRFGAFDELILAFIGLSALAHCNPAAGHHEDGTPIVVRPCGRCGRSVRDDQTCQHCFEEGVTFDRCDPMINWHVEPHKGCVLR